MNRLLVLILFLAINIFGQAAQSNNSQVASSNPAMQLHGNGSPLLSQWVCGSNIGNVLYIQDDAVDGRVWVCETFDSGVSWNWIHFVNPISNYVATATISTGTIIGAGAYTTTIAFPGAIPGKHTVYVAPFADPGNLIIPIAFVSAADQVTLRIVNLSATASAANSVKWSVMLVRATP